MTISTAALRLFAAGFLFAGSVHAVPQPRPFSYKDTGIMGCNGVAAARSAPAMAWDAPIFAQWKVVGEATPGTMVLQLNGQLLSGTYQRSRHSDNRTSSLSGMVGGYAVDITFEKEWHKGEVWGGKGALRIYSDIPGDSISIPIRVAEGC